MATRIRNPKDFWSGLAFVGAGAAFLYLGQDYALGTARRMGPGYFPMVLAVLLVLVGLVVTARGLMRDGERVGSFAVLPMVLVIGGTVAFGLLVRSAGLLAASIVLVGVSAFASPAFRWKQAVLLALGLAVFCILVFTRGLGLPIPVIGPLLGG
jgi:putative tricarboxylic transport membrane protein